MSAKSPPKPQNVLKVEDVETALGMLSSEIDKEVARINGVGGQAQTQGNLDAASAFIDFARKIEGFAKQVDKLKSGWSDLCDLAEETPLPEVKAELSKTFIDRADAATITTGQTFHRPILEALVEMGGQGRTARVVDRVGEKLEKLLTVEDRNEPPSGRGAIRWRRNCEWVRFRLIKAGLMRSDSPYGIWAISDEGRAWLKSGK